MKKELLPERPPRGEAATEEDSERNISRKERKGRKKIVHHRGAEFTESGVFIIENFLLCALSASA